MAEVDRARFLPPETRPYADSDHPLTIGHGATCSQPTTVLAMLELLDVPAGAKVLDVGSGSGWTTAILARLVGASGSVLGIEVVPELVERSRAALSDHLAASPGRAHDDAHPGAHRTEPQRIPSDATGPARATIRLADAGVLGAPDDGPFDRILVSAMAGAVPEELAGQLAVGGVMVVPTDGRLVRVTRTDQGWDEEPAPGSYLFVPLR